MLHIYIILLSKNLWLCLNRSLNTQKFAILLCRQSIESLFLTCIVDLCLRQIHFHNEILQRVTIITASGPSWLHFRTSLFGETYEDLFRGFWKWLSWKLFFLADNFLLLLFWSFHINVKQKICSQKRQIYISVFLANSWNDYKLSLRISSHSIKGEF